MFAVIALMSIWVICELKLLILSNKVKWMVKPHELTGGKY